MPPFVCGRRFRPTRFLVRVVFCLFADDTGVFEPRDIFLDFIEPRTGEDGADLGPWPAQLFEVLDTPEDQRPATLDEDLTRFPYVNGDLFKGCLRTFSFDAAMRGALLDACRFDWSNISPAIFGALFQSVMDPVERRAQGAHYTTEKNILKVIEPLFMDDLRAEFERVKARRGRLAALRQSQAKLGDMTFFDPACGCGNFLIIACQELRPLEIEVIREIRDATATTTQTVLDVVWQSEVDVDQFCGIEPGEFPAHIAETALWMMDHIMNNRPSLEFGQTFVRIPLQKSPHIVHGDALETDWPRLLPPDDCSFVLGNPPFVGAKYQTAEQRAQVRGIAALDRSGGTPDYVAAWFIKAGQYVKGGNARIGFVATNSITQGEQAAQLWPLLFDRCKLEIASAHHTSRGIGRARQGACAHRHSGPRPGGRSRDRKSACSAIPTSTASLRTKQELYTIPEFQSDAIALRSDHDLGGVLPRLRAAVFHRNVRRIAVIARNGRGHEGTCAIQRLLPQATNLLQRRAAADVATTDVDRVRCPVGGIPNVGIAISRLCACAPGDEESGAKKGTTAVEWERSVWTFHRHLTPPCSATTQRWMRDGGRKYTPCPQQDTSIYHARNRTQVLQDIRRMRFEEAYGGWQERRLTQEEAARLLGVWRASRRRVFGLEDGEAEAVDVIDYH